MNPSGCQKFAGGRMKFAKISPAVALTVVMIFLAATLSAQTQDQKSKEPTAAVKLQPLNVKPGLWETTLTYNRSGAAPITPEVLARLTPEQRARLEERMKASSGANTSTVTDKHCVTKQDVEKADFGQGKGDCTYIIQSSTSTLAKGKYSCDIEGMKVNGALEIHAPDPEHIKGTSQGSMSGGGHTMNLDSTFTSKFVAASCPDVNSTQ
jgi:Protein of unknown function (DUF3617)